MIYHEQRIYSRKQRVMGEKKATKNPSVQYNRAIDIANTSTNCQVLSLVRLTRLASHAFYDSWLSLSFHVLPCHRNRRRSSCWWLAWTFFPVPRNRYADACHRSEARRWLPSLLPSRLGCVLWMTPSGQNPVEAVVAGNVVDGLRAHAEQSLSHVRHPIIQDENDKTSFRLNVHAKVSSMLTISLALVSMNPHPCFRAYSRPSRAETVLASFRSHLFPAMILTGGGIPTSTPSAPGPSSLNNRSLSSNRCSASMSIISIK